MEIKILKKTDDKELILLIDINDTKTFAYWLNDNGEVEGFKTFSNSLMNQYEQDIEDFDSNEITEETKKIIIQDIFIECQ